MSEQTTTSVRLSKAAKEFNIALATAVEFLVKKGYPLSDANPNTKLSEDQYLVLQKEFQKDKSVLEKAHTLEIGMEKKPVPITVAAVEKKEKKTKSAVEIEEDITIKTNTIEDAETTKNRSKKTVETEEKIKEEEKVEKKVEKPTKKKNDKSAAEPAMPKSTAEPAEKEKKSVAKPKATESVVKETPVETMQTEEKGLKVLGHIDIKGSSSKNGREELKKAAKEFEKAAKEAAKDAGKAATQAQLQKEKETKKVQKEQQEPEQLKPEEKETVRVHAPTLMGPKIVSDQKIDLTKFTESSPHSRSDKKKRKRVKRQADASSSGTIPANMGKDAAGKKDKNKNAASGGGKKDSGKKKKKPQNVFSNQDIESQIKETLSKMSTTGKSARAKRSREKRIEIINKIGKEQEQIQQEQKTLKLTEFVTANELATMMNIPVTDIIKTSMELGYFVSINQRLDAELIRILAEDHNYEVSFVDAEVLDELQNIAEEDDDNDEAVPRIPIVTVMGHVDHGKTSLLDYIRKTNVIAGEAGGITQHIGAYEVQLESGKRITFLDTPGHEAFTAMRARGAKVTDIAIIVVAADDKVMPQTIEAINHAQAAGVPIIFAINKVDKDAADPDKIKTELANMNYLVEEWGGKYQSKDISAKKGLNIDALLDEVLLAAEVLDLKAHPGRKAKGTILEASLDKGRGYVAKVLVQDGTARIGDPIIAGSVSGRVKAMYNERNQPVKEAGPSTPVLLLGLTGAPQAGDMFNVAASEKEARDIATKRAQLQREQGMRTQKHITLDEIGRRIAIGDFKELNIIVKGDVDGSIEALSDELIKLSNNEVQVNVIHKSVGQIIESDVMLASASNAIIVGFQVRPSLSARKLAETEQIDIRTYSVIYEAKDEIKDAIEGMLSPELQEKVQCNLEVREVFKVKAKEGNITIAGCFVADGKLTRQQKIRILRDGIVVKEGRKIASLRRFKDDVKEVVAGQDCGVGIENFDDIKVGDVLEGYDIIEVKKTL
ncbi:MAG: translation initiation factor IF-2 [Bacteroidales bacterium]|jgi:translation initiation factor IF-2|nr:translation initiation factor IF-2 [Bacteroidales bacterium]